jgi:acyl CoA:acetate/3-ketoacid CoA transferase alpha subunit
MTATLTTAAEAVSAIRSGDTVMVGGFRRVGAPLTLMTLIVTPIVVPLTIGL